MAFSFTVAKPKDVAATMETLKQKIEKHKGTFEGDTTSGRATSDGVALSYVVTADAIEITVEKKPAIYPASAVEREIRKYFAQ